MTNKDIRAAYDSVAPTEAQKEKMLDAILSQVPRNEPVRKDVVVMKKYTRKPALMAAMVAVALLLVGCAAAVVLGLQDLKVADVTYPTLPGEEPETREVISLQGFAGSIGYEAVREWVEFSQSYDPDGSRHASSIYHHYQTPEAYDSIFHYTQEEVEKLDEICKKYNLKPRGKWWTSFDSAGPILDAIGVADIRAEGAEKIVTLDSADCHADGSFSVSGVYQFPGTAIGDWFSYSCLRKGYFHGAIDYLKSIDDYSQWEYTMQDGTKVLLAANSDQALAIAERDDFFVTLQLTDQDTFATDPDEKKAEIEKIVECFVFSVQPQPADRAKLDAIQAKLDDFYAEQERQFDEDYRSPDYKTYIGSHIYRQDRGDKYALADLNSDGMDELIITFRDSVDDILTSDGIETSLLMTARRLSSVSLMDGNEFWLAENGILVEHVVCGNCQRYCFFHLENGEYKLFDFVEYHAETSAWTRSQDGDEECEQQLTEAEANQIISSYTPMDLDFKPISEFPMD